MTPLDDATLDAIEYMDEIQAVSTDLVRALVAEVRRLRAFERTTRAYCGKGSGNKPFGFGPEAMAMRAALEAK